MLEKIIIIFCAICLVLSILIFIFSKDNDDKIVLVKSKLLKGCFEKWTYLNGIPIKFEMIWQEEIDKYFEKLRKKQNEQNTKSKPKNKRIKKGNAKSNA